MSRHVFKNTWKILSILFSLSVMISCNANNEGENKDRTGIHAEKEAVPDTIVRFLITSAANDFRNHQPPTPIDFRNVKIGYIKSADNGKIFLLCGELLSQENKEWIEFTTIKTSGYEQYIGKTSYCQDATVMVTGENLVVALKHKLAE